jgi:hypothetical protein
MSVWAQTTSNCTPPADFAAFVPPDGINGRFEAAFIPVGHAMNGNESVVAIRSDGSMVGPPTCVSQNTTTNVYFFEKIKVTRTLDCVTAVEAVLGPSENNPNAQALIAQCEANKNSDRSLQVITPGEYEEYLFVMYDPDEGGRYFRVDDNGNGLFPANDSDIDFLSDAIALPERNPVELTIPTESFSSLADVVPDPIVCVIPADIAVYDPPQGINGRFDAAFTPLGHPMNGNEVVVAIREDGRMVGPGKCVSQDATTGTYFFEEIKITRTLDCVTAVEAVLGPSDNNPAAQQAIAQCEAGKNTDRSLQVLAPGEYEKYLFVMYDPDEGGRYYRIDNNGTGAFPANNSDIDFLQDAIPLPKRNRVGLQVPSDFSGSLSETALPVEFVSFTGTARDGSTYLEWATATETENDYFEIERSFEGVAFTAIGRVAGAGDSRTMLHYAFQDEQPGSGTTYYRLKQVDYDGSFAYSDIISVQSDGNSEFNLKLTPNPAFGNVVVMTKPYERETTVGLLDLSGRMLRRWTMPPTVGSISLNIRDLPQGTYVIRTVSGNESHIAKLVKR